MKLQGCETETMEDRNILMDYEKNIEEAAAAMQLGGWGRTRYSLEKMASLMGARLFGKSETEVEHLLTDSRSLAFPESSLFFALKTRVGDGHKYIPDLYRRGVRAFVVADVPADFSTHYPGAAFLQVVCPLRALQRLAERHRDAHPMPVIGVTGSNGKTIVKEWLYQMLAPVMHVTRSPRSYNSQVGVPLSVWLLTPQTGVGIFEAGISQPGEMDALRAIIQPSIGVFTNIGQAHQENFQTLEDKCTEKLKLFSESEVLIYCADDAVVNACVERSNYGFRRLGWSMQRPECPIYVAKVQKEEQHTRITYRYAGREAEVSIPFVDEASITNAIHCLAVSLCLQLTPESTHHALARLEPVGMRLEVKQGLRSCTIINDSYNSDINSLDIALDFMARRPEASGGRKILVLSDILQSGLTHEQLYARVAEMLSRRGVDLLMGVGREITAAASLFAMPCHFFQDSESLLESGLLDTLEGDIVLLKGARPFNFEQLGERLARRVHETILEVNLEAVAENLNFYRSFMQPDTKMVCMVKASAYGSGAVEIAKTLQDRGVDFLAVAVADEGVELRKAGITGDIIIMNPEPTAFGTMFRHALQPEVYSFRLLDLLIRAAESEGITDYPVHIKLDTGMHRLGFHPEIDLPVLIDRLRHQSALTPRSVFSHFVGSDSGGFDAFSQQQFERFDVASRRLQQAFSHKVLRHICNSAGIERFPERHLDMVRLGLGLYGVSPIDGHIIHNVATLKTTILQIREVEAGDTVGYSRRGQVKRLSRIAALPIGYADGLDRRLGNGVGYCLVGGKPASYAGNICMDVCMIDVTDIPCAEGDSVEIFGNQLPVTVLSEKLGTIPYEILTSVSERVKRVYYKE